MGVGWPLVAVRRGRGPCRQKGRHHIVIFLSCVVSEAPRGGGSGGSTWYTVAPGSLLVPRFVHVVLDDVLLPAEPYIHEHISGYVSPAYGTVFGGVGDALDTHHAEDVPALQGQRKGDGSQTDRAFLGTFVVRPILTAFILGLEVLVVVLVVELKVLELDVLGAALAALGARLAVLQVALQLRRRHLQLAVLTGHQAPRALLLLVGEEAQGFHLGVALGTRYGLVGSLDMLLVL